MLGFLFRTLTTQAGRGAALFAAATAEARSPHWYVEGAVPDTIDGRFAMLATIVALAIVRLEQAGDEGNAASVALTERFIEVMESEHREMGLGDPKLGRTVRKLVGALSRRVALWRSAAAGQRDWSETARESLYKDQVPADALDHSATALQRLWTAIQALDLSVLLDGRLE
ncbi:MAG TPA: ubiquinol-cytochrome C chaperone family protein [Sphingomicrobium sp.]|jgi:cytochrome b pre-mRNA-processing protein 3|nr:ubiquinol-cytochrome C chaperone family protein [Sphingomicrobium sp.]